MQQRLLLTDGHLSATDADTVLAGAVDPSKIMFRISTGCGRKTSESFVLLGHLAGHDAGDR